MNFKRLLLKGVIPAGLKISNAGLGYLTTLMAAWLLSPADYGLFGTVIAFSILCSFALSYGQPVALIKFYNESSISSGEAGADRMLSWSMLVGTLCLLISTTLGCFWLFQGKSGITGILLIILFCVLFAMGELLCVALRVKERMIEALAPRDFGWRLVVILAFALLYWTEQRWSALALITLMSLLLLPFLLYQLYLLRPHLHWVPHPAREASYHRRSCYFWGIVLTGPILTQAGTLIVSSSFDLTASGAYFSAERTSNLLSFLLVAIHIVVGPRISRSYEERNFAHTQRLVGLSALAASTVALLLFVPLALFSGPVLGWFSAGYRAQGDLLIWLAVVQLINSFAGVTAFFLQMAGREKLTLTLSAWFTALSLILQLVVARYGSIEGIAMVSAAVALLLNASCIYACRRLTGVDSTLVGLFRKQGMFR